MELFAGRGPGNAALRDEGGRDLRFPDPPTHHARAEDSSTMLVIRDALLLQLQKDRLRQEVILAELAKIERAMALRAADAERATPVAPFSFLEETPHRHSREAVGRADHGIIAVDVDALKKKEKKKKRKDGVRGGVELESRKPATEDLVRECLKTSCGAGNAAGQQNAALGENKLQKPNELELRRKEMVKDKAVTAAAPPTNPEGALATEFARREPDILRLYATRTRLQQPTGPKTPLPPLGWELPEITITVDRPRSCGRWSCAVCQVDAASKHEIQLHRAGKKHCANAAAVEARIKAIGALKAAKPKKRRLQYKPADQENEANIEQKSTEFNEPTPERTSAGVKRKLRAPSSPVKEQKPLGQWSCIVCLCQVDRASRRGLKEHLAGKRHWSNFEKLQTSWSRTGWTCTLCQAKGTSESDYYRHLETSRHREKAKARRAELVGRD